MYPPDSFTAATIDDVGFEDWTRCNFRLSTDSFYTARATDGADIGVTADSSFPPGCGRGVDYIDSPWLSTRGRIKPRAEPGDRVFALRIMRA